MNKVVLGTALAAGLAYTFHESRKDAAVKADDTERKRKEREKVEQYRERINSMGKSQQARAESSTFNSTYIQVRTLRRVLMTLRDALRGNDSSSPLLQMPCLSTGKFSSAAVAIFGYAVLWGNPAVLAILESGGIEDVDLTVPGMSLACLTPETVRLLADFRPAQTINLAAEDGRAVRFQEEGCAGEAKNKGLRWHKRDFWDGDERVCGISSRVVESLLRITHFARDAKPEMTVVTVASHQLEGFEILVRTLGLWARLECDVQESFERGYSAFLGADYHVCRSLNLRPRQCPPSKKKYKKGKQGKASSTGGCSPTTSCEPSIRPEDVSAAEKAYGGGGKDGTGKWLLTNFDLALTYRVEFAAVETNRRGDGSISSVFSATPTKYAPQDPVVSRSAEAEAAAAHLAAVYSVYKEGQVVSKRLQALLGGEHHHRHPHHHHPQQHVVVQPSLEHFEAMSGSWPAFEHGLLAFRRDSDLALLDMALGPSGEAAPPPGGTRKTLAQRLLTDLLRVVPPPLTRTTKRRRTWRAENQQRQADEGASEGEEAREARRVAEAADFVWHYVEVLALKPLVVPQLVGLGGGGRLGFAGLDDDGRVPLDLLPLSGNRSAFSEAMEGFLADMETTPLAFTRALELKYRSRALAEREALEDMEEKLAAARQGLRGQMGQAQEVADKGKEACAAWLKRVRARRFVSGCVLGALLVWICFKGVTSASTWAAMLRDYLLLGWWRQPVEVEEGEGDGLLGGDVQLKRPQQQQQQQPLWAGLRLALAFALSWSAAKSVGKTRLMPDLLGVPRGASPQVLAVALSDAFFSSRFAAGLLGLGAAMGAGTRRLGAAMGVVQGGGGVGEGAPGAPRVGGGWRLLTPLAARLRHAERKCLAQLDQWAVRGAVEKMRWSMKAGRIRGSVVLAIMDELTQGATRHWQEEEEEEEEDEEEGEEEEEEFEFTVEEVVVDEHGAGETKTKKSGGKQQRGAWAAPAPPRQGRCSTPGCVAGAFPTSQEEAEAFLELPILEGSDKTSAGTGRGGRGPEDVKSNELFSSALEQAVVDTAFANAFSASPEHCGHGIEVSPPPPITPWTPSYRFEAEERVWANIGEAPGGGDEWVRGTVVAIGYRMTRAFYEVQIDGAVARSRFFLVPVDDDSWLAKLWESEGVSVGGGEGGGGGGWGRSETRQEAKRRAKMERTRMENGKEARSTADRLGSGGEFAGKHQHEGEEGGEHNEKEATVSRVEERSNEGAKTATATKTGGVRPPSNEPRTVRSMLEANGWSFKRQRGHVIYERRVEFSNGRMGRQVHTSATTPSDWRSTRNQLSQLRGANEGVVHVR